MKKRATIERERDEVRHFICASINTLGDFNDDDESFFTSVLIDAQI